MIIETLYPEICNLFGDRMNARYLAGAAGARVVETPLGDAPAFTRGDADPVDLVYLGSTTEKGQEYAIDALRPYTGALRERIDSGGAVLATGNALELFCEEIAADGADIPGLGVVAGVVARRFAPRRYNGLYLGAFEDMEIVGFNSRFSEIVGRGGGAPLFKTSRGAGSDGQSLSGEGFRVNNFMATYLLGPLLILNPPFTKWLLRLLGAESAALPFERAAFNSYEKRLGEFSDPKTGFEY
jgi:CobQ-like glutamine amidotransferase family enzyme